MRIGLNLLYLLPSVAGGGETYARGLLEAIVKISDPQRYWIFVNKETRMSGLFRNQNYKVVLCKVSARLREVRYAYEQLIFPHQIQKHKISLLHSLGNVSPLRLSCKSVVTIHDLNFYNLGSLMPRKRRAVLRYFVTRGARVADHIITVSEFSKRQIIELLGVPSEKITVIYNAPKKKPSHRTKFEAMQQSYAINKPYILALSSPSPHKNIGNLIRAFNYLKELKRCEAKDLKLILVGHRPRDGGEVDRLVKNSPYRNDIVFTGYVPDEALATLYEHALIFVFPSIYEGFGIPVLEAFSYGTPVVCSRAAAIPEIAGDAAFYFNPLDPGDIAEAIFLLLCSEVLRRHLIEKGKERVSQFTWEETAKRTLEVYRKVLQG